MKKSEFIQLHLNLKIQLPHVCEKNVVNSATDPTQDIPIRCIQFAANGLPLNVREYKSVMTNVRIEDFTAVERRNTDQFDVLGEYMAETKKVSLKDVTTNFVKNKTKKLKKYEI